MHEMRCRALRHFAPDAPPLLVHLSASMLGDTAIPPAILRHFANHMEFADSAATDLAGSDAEKTAPGQRVRHLAEAVRRMAARRDLP